MSVIFQCLVFSTFSVTPSTDDLGHTLQKFGFHFLDALHIACAESGQVDIFLTTDDRILKKSVKYAQELKVSVIDPVSWLMEVSQWKE
ncbi:hypothetical protein WDW89_04365 [Deltaproteobacteria bacterium TL4]